MNDSERDELLIRLDERTAALVKSFSAHVKHHWMISIPVGLLILGLVIKLLV